MFKTKIRTLLLAVAAVCAMQGWAAAQNAGQRVMVQDIQFSGNTAISSDMLSEVVGTNRGKEMSLAELRALADSVSEYYRARGYFLAKAVLPEQDIVNGVVNLEILEGKPGKVEITGNNHYATSFLDSFFNRIRRQGVIRKNNLERALLIMNSLPGLKATSVLEAGDVKGTTDILVTVVEGKQTRGTLEADNFGSRFARVRAQAGVDFMNALNRGDVCSLSGLAGLSSDDLYYFNANCTVPVDANGTSLGFYGLSGDFGVGKEFTALDIQGSAYAMGMYATRILKIKQNGNIGGEIGLDIKNSEQDMLGINSSTDHIVSLRLGVKKNATDKEGRTYAGFTITQGLGEMLGGMENDDPKSSRAAGGADNSFTKLNIELARIQILTEKAFLIARLNGQLTNKSVVAGEQFSIGGADSVRGFSQSVYGGDKGFQISLEGRFASSKERLEKLQFAVFLESGHVSVKNPVLGQIDSKTITGAGLGLRAYPGNDLLIRADVGFPVGGKETGDDSVVPYLQIMKGY